MLKPPVIRSALLQEIGGVRHAFFTRHGGVSDGLYASLNVGRGSGDDPAAVAENRRRAAACFEASESSLNTCHQIHSALAVIAERPWADARPQADAVVAATPGLVCGALAADCAPILIADGEAGVVAAVHAGWRGALGGVIASAVRVMVEAGALPERMVAAVGPCIAPASYEVGLEFLERFEREAPHAAAFFSPGVSTEKRQFDLPGFVLSQLALAGVPRAEWTGQDTGADTDFFSSRRAVRRGEGDYGRLLSAIMLAP